MNMLALLSEERSAVILLLVGVLMGGGAAFLAGRAIASGWRPWWNVVVYMLPLAAAVRFMHFALFQSSLLSPYYYLVDFALCLGFGLVGFRVTRVRQMVTRYNWLHESAGPFDWRGRRVHETPESG
jgi:hypothetical protein